MKCAYILGYQERFKDILLGFITSVQRVVDH